MKMGNLQWRFLRKVNIRINRIAYPVVTLGPGRRLGVWVQGCHIRCYECVSIDTWDPEGGYEVDVEVLASEMASAIADHDLTGITITGGEPIEQVNAVFELIVCLQKVLEGCNRLSKEQCLLDILVFSGLQFDDFKRHAPILHSVIDGVVCGPYDPSYPRTSPLIASGNQELHIITNLGEQRFGQIAQSIQSVMQLHVDDENITLIGLPRFGDLRLLEEALGRRGIIIEEGSWRR